MTYSIVDQSAQGTAKLRTLTSIIDRVSDAAKEDQISLRDVLSAVGDASFAPILLLPAMAVATPLSGIPLFSALMGIIIFLVSLQMLLRRDQLWLPKWVLRRSLKGETVRKAFGYLRPVAGWLDKRTDKRLRVLTHRPFVFIPQLLCVISGAMMPALEFVPFSSSILGIGVAILALSILTRDGLVLLIGLLPYGIVWWLITGAIG